jgi:ketosteroid isomerase-like protein
MMDALVEGMIFRGYFSLAAASRQVKLSGCGSAGAEGSQRVLDFAIERGAIMSGKSPVDTVLAFLEHINAGSVDGLCALMTEDHLFVDGLGNSVQVREAMRKGWAGYRRMFPDYRVSHTDVFSQDDVVAALGSAEGTLAVKGELPKENHWSVPAAWRVVVRDGLIAEWHVYADNQGARKIMAVPKP